MPTVGKKKFPYTKAGMKAAKKEAKKKEAKIPKTQESVSPGMRQKTLKVADIRKCIGEAIDMLGTYIQNNPDSIKARRATMSLNNANAILNALND